MKQAVFLGMIPRRDPGNLPENTAQMALDADLSRSVLGAFRTDALLRDDANAGTQVWMAASGCRVNLPCDASVAEQIVTCPQVFATGVAAYPVRATEANWAIGFQTRLGLPCPESAPDVAWGSIVLKDNEAMPRAFFYTYANEFDEEGPGSPPSYVTLVNYDTTAVIGGFVPAPAEYRATHYVIYMLQPGVENLAGTPAGDEAKWFEIGRIPVTQSTFTYTPDLRLGKLYTAFSYGEPPADLRDIQLCGDNVLAGLSGDDLVFSEPNVYGAWPEKYRLKFHATPLRFLAGQAYGYVLTCGAPEVVGFKMDCSRGGCREIATLQEDLPLVGLRAAAVYEGACYYASRQGIVMLAGPRARVISEGLWTQAQWERLLPHTMTFVVHQGYLFGASATHAFRWKVPTGMHENPAPGDYTELSLRASSWFRRGAELYYVGAEGGLYWWARGASRKRYAYRTRPFSLPGYTAPRVLLVEADGPDLDVALTTDDVSHYVGPVPRNKPLSLRRGIRGRSSELLLTGTSTVTELKLALSIPDLARL